MITKLPPSVYLTLPTKARLVRHAAPMDRKPYSEDRREHAPPNKHRKSNHTLKWKCVQVSKAEGVFAKLKY